MVFKVCQTFSDGTVKRTLPTLHSNKNAAIRTADRVYQEQGFGVQVVDVQTGNPVYVRRKDNDQFGVT